MIGRCAQRLKAWGKEIQRGHDAAIFEALPQMLKDKIEKELKDMEQPVFIVGREHSLKIGEHVYLKEPVSTRRYATVYTTGIKAEAHQFADPSEAQRSAELANLSAPEKYQFLVGLPEQFRNDITASQREAHRQHKLEEARARKMQEIASTGVSTEEAERAILANELDGATLLNRENLDKIFDVTENKERVEVNAIVEHPAHYNQGSIDVIEALYQLLTWEQFKGFMQGNIIKYSVRFEDKDDPILDLEKAQYYTKRLKEYRKRHHEAELEANEEGDEWL